MSEKMTARERLLEKKSEIMTKQDELRRKYFPTEVRREYYKLQRWLESIDDSLREKTDLQLEWELGGGLERCPICATKTKNSDFNTLILHTCEEIDCPSFDTCWATESLTPPFCVVLTSYPSEENTPVKSTPTFIEDEKKEVK